MNLSDPFWQSIIGIVAVITAIVIYLLQRKRKALSCEVVERTPLLTREEEIGSELQVMFKGMAVQDVYLMAIKILNSGNTPITSSDYERQVSIGFGKDSKILSAQISNCSPESLQPAIHYEDERLSLVPILLNSGDSINIKALVIKPDHRIDLDGRIVGIKSIQSAKPASKQAQSAVQGIIFGLLFGVVASVSINLFQGGKKDQFVEKHASTESDKSPKAPILATNLGQSADEARSELRRKSGLRLLEPTESQLSLSEVPGGVYGFVSSSVIKYGDPFLYRFGSKRRSFEIHKVIDGSTYIVGFVATEVANQLKLKERPKNFKVTIYADKWAAGQEIVAIPLSALTDRVRDREIDIDKDNSVHALDLTLK